MISIKRAGVFAVAAAAALFGLSVSGQAAHSATAVNPDSAGSASSPFGWNTQWDLNGVPTCNTATGLVSVAWTFSYTTPSLDWSLDIASTSPAGVLSGSQSMPSQASGVDRTLTFTGTSTGNAPGDIALTVNYAINRGGLAAPINNTATATVASGTCSATTTTAAPTTTTTAAPTTTTAAGVTTTAAVTTTTAAATTTTAAAVTTTKAVTTTTTAAVATTKAVVLGTTATPLPATGTNVGLMLAASLVFLVLGVSLISLDHKRRRA